MRKTPIKNMKQRLVSILSSDPLLDYACELHLMGYKEEDVAKHLLKLKDIPQPLTIKLLTYIRDLDRGFPPYKKLLKKKEKYETRESN
jgi:hypothetical protein